MLGTAVLQQSPMLLTLRENQAQATGSKDAAEGVVPEVAVTKYVADEAEASTAQNTHHRSETSKDKLKIMERS